MAPCFECPELPQMVHCPKDLPDHFPPGFAEGCTIHQLPCGCIALDAIGRILAVNNTQLRVLGYQRSEVVGRLRMQDLLEEPFQSAFEEQHRRFLRSGQLFNAMRVLRTKYGTQVPALMNASICATAEGRFSHCLGVFTYIATPPDSVTAWSTVAADATCEEAPLVPLARTAVPSEALSRREREVLIRVASGWTSQRIAEALGITLGTVEVHRRNLKSKLELHTTADLTRYAILSGLTLL